MTAGPLTLHPLQSSAHTETMSCIGPRPVERAIDFDLERSPQSRRRHRILISAQRLAALFEGHGGRSQSLH
jgi:hypothetical protein